MNDESIELIRRLRKVLDEAASRLRMQSLEPEPGSPAATILMGAQFAIGEIRNQFIREFSKEGV